MIPFLTALLLCSTFAHYIPNMDIPNVGSVLFSTNDLAKSRWSRSKIELLRTRQYFQNVIPSPRLTDTVTEEYLIHLLGYFKDSYATIKREIDDSALREMMETAYSDAIGGFLKVWVLPVTKYAYYGGTISLDNALKVFRLYENIKKNLNSDGQNWQNPNNNLLNYVAINIVPPEHTYVRSMDDSCDELAYFEKSDKGLTIPLPVIDWNNSPSTMFLPLKNRSLIPLDSTNSSKTLQKYYDVALNCMRTQNSESLYDFEERFQEWLGTDIIPHLNDTNLYIPFGNVLGLLNTTKPFENHMIKKCKPKKKITQLGHGFPLNLSSKKFWIIAILLFVEIVWCIPTLLYVLISNKKKKRTPKNCFSWIKSHRNDYCNFASNGPRATENIETNDRETCTSAYTGLGVEPKLFFKPQSKKSYVKFSSYGSKFIITDEISKEDQTNLNDFFTVEHSCRKENSASRDISKPLPNVNMISVENKNKLSVENKCNRDDIKVMKTSTSIQKAESIITLNNRDSEKTIQRITYSQCSSKPIEKISHTIHPMVDSFADKNCKKLNVGLCPEGKKSSKHKSAIRNEHEKKIRSHKTDIKGPLIQPKLQQTKQMLQPKTQISQSKEQDTHRKGEVSVTTKKETNNTKKNMYKKIIKKTIPIPINKEVDEAQLKVGITTYNDCSGSQKASKIPRRLIIIDYKQNKDKLPKCLENSRGYTKKQVQEFKMKCLEDSNAKNNLEMLPNIQGINSQCLEGTKLKNSVQKVRNDSENKMKCKHEKPITIKVEKKTNVVSKLRHLSDHDIETKFEKNTNVLTKIRCLDDSNVKKKNAATENRKMNITL